MKMSQRPIVKACLLLGVMFGLMTAVSTADDPAESGKQKVREKFRAERPDASRGWVVVSKQSYWPLCYESLDRIEEARKLFGSGNHEELADSLEKCQAWLRLAASAAMTDGKSGVIAAADFFDLAAQIARKGDGKVKPEALNDLATLGLLCMAKSHALRAKEADTEYKAETSSGKAPKKVSAEIAATNREIAAEKVKQLREQYRFDTIESRKHLVVAQAYLDAAAESGEFAIDPAIKAKIPAVPASDDLEGYVDDEVRSRATSMINLIDTKRAALNKSLESALSFF